MSLILIAAPAIEPVRLDELKAFARVQAAAGTPVAIAGIARAGNVVTGHVIAHGLTVGQQALAVAILDPSFNGVWTVSTVPDADHLVWAQAAPNATSSGGTLALAGPDDAVLLLFLATARQQAEDYTRRVFITQTWRLQRDGFPSVDARYANQGFHQFFLPNPPFQSVVVFQYVDTAGVTQTLALPSDPIPGYQLDAGSASQPARLLPPYARPWPPTRMVPNNVIVDFVCGYGDAPENVPAPIRTAIMQAASFFFLNRDADAVLPQQACNLLDPYRNLIA